MTTLLDARAAYFEANDFGVDGGYSKATVTVYVLGLPFSIPNTAGRKKAVVFHDMHHILTGYQTNNLGEAEIGAWELGSGCASYRAALVLNTLSLGLGILKSPRRLFRAFVRGRRTQNLYGGDAAALLERDVKSVQAELGLDKPPGPASIDDVLRFAAFLTVALLAYVSPFLVLAWLLL